MYNEIKAIKLFTFLSVLHQIQNLKSHMRPLTYKTVNDTCEMKIKIERREMGEILV